MTTRGQGGPGWAPRSEFGRGGSWGRRGEARDQRGRGWVPRDGLGGSNLLEKRENTRDQGRGGRGNNVCRNFQAGRCRFGARCRFSHGLMNSNEQEPSSPVRERKEQDHEEEK